MRISVVIPTFNNDSYIIDALDSVLMQTRSDLIHEIIVVNDGSTDNTVEMVNRFIRAHQGTKIILINQSNMGVSVARNVGMKAATGDWIALLDSDDCWMPSKTEVQAEYIMANDKIDFIGGNHHEKPLRILWRRISSIYKASINDLCIKWFPVTPSAMFKKKIFIETGGFNEMMKHSEDAEFFARVCCKYNYFYIPDNVVTIGHGKNPYGETGLSAELRSMYIGNVEIFKMLKQKGFISNTRYYFTRIFAFLKYIRRVLIVGGRKTFQSVNRM